MAEPIVVIALPLKNIFEPVEERLVRVSPMTADAQNRNVKRDQRVNKCRELKSPIRRPENNQAADSGKNFEPPGEAVVRINSRPGENNRDADQQHDVRFFHRKELIRKTGRRETRSH